jgi:hypothetical protein
MPFNKLIPVIVMAALAFSCESDMVGASGETGQGGSMARFTISGNYLYLVDKASVKVFNTIEGEFQMLYEEAIAFGMETIFAKGDYLYLGASDAMYIYSIVEPSKPKFVFRYQHIVSCDPVVVQGDRAYVTTRSGDLCDRGSNALEIVDISDPYAPVLVRNYPMSSPHGLGIDANRLFLCEGELGLKIFDVTNEQDIQLLEHRDDFFAYDVIVRQGVATVTGKDGIFQFGYAETQDPVSLLSKIPVVRVEL